jgi:5S rRNA maturation endonuclease (ribonuclease M5)
VTENTIVIIAKEGLFEEFKKEIPEIYQNLRIIFLVDFDNHTSGLFGYYPE